MYTDTEGRNLAGPVIYNNLFIFNIARWFNVEIYIFIIDCVIYVLYKNHTKNCLECIVNL